MTAFCFRRVSGPTQSEPSLSAAGSLLSLCPLWRLLEIAGVVIGNFCRIRR